MKRHKTWFSLGLIALSALALALILTVLPAGAVHNDDNIVGTVTTSPVVASPDNDVPMADRTITITVEDPNLHSIQFVGTGGGGEPSNAMDSNGATYGADGEAVGDGGAPSNVGPFTRDLANAIADRNHDGTVDAKDIQVRPVGAGVSVTVSRILNAEAGIVEFISSGSGGAFSVRYATSTREYTQATASDGSVEELVTVQGDGEAMFLRLRETNSSSGKFTATVVVVNGDDAAVMDSTGDGANLDPTNTTRPTLAVSDGSSIIVRYNDKTPARTVTARIDVEDDPPNFSNVMPAHKTETNNLDTVLTAEVSDNIAGVDTDEVSDSPSIRLWYSIDGGTNTQATPSDVSVEETSAGSGVYVISYNINKIGVISTEKKSQSGNLNVTIDWWIQVKDKAGNEGRTDADSMMDGDQAGMLTVKTTRPVLEDAYTGDNWDASKPEGQRLRGSRTGNDNPVTAGTSDKRTSIRLVFDRNMMASSLQTSDFEVDDAEPTGVALGSGAHAKSVFLTVPEMSPDATPKIEVVGEVLDAGGNSVNTNTTDGSVVNKAVDGIAPKLTITVEDDYTTGAIQLMVMSDEPIRGSQPQLTFTSCSGEGNTTKNCTQSASPGISPRVVESRKEWSFSVTGLGEGLYTVKGPGTGHHGQHGNGRLREGLNCHRCRHVRDRQDSGPRHRDGPSRRYKAVQY